MSAKSRKSKINESLSHFGRPITADDSLYNGRPAVCVINLQTHKF